MRKWTCKRTSVLLEDEPLVILTMLEDDEVRSDLTYGGRGITESQAKKLLDELEYQKEKKAFSGFDLWGDFDYDEDYWGLEWYEDERY